MTNSSSAAAVTDPRRTTQTNAASWVRVTATPAAGGQCPAGASQPSSTGGFQSVPTVRELLDPGAELGLRELRVLRP